MVGVDADPALIEAARADHPGARWLVADLAELDLAALGEPEPFDAAVIAGNVMTFVAPGTEADDAAAGAARTCGRTARSWSGSRIDRGYSLADFDRDIAAAGLRVEHRFATWDLLAWHERRRLRRHRPAHDLTLPTLGSQRSRQARTSCRRTAAALGSAAGERRQHVDDRARP